MDNLLLDQLSVFDAPVIVDSTPIRPAPRPLRHTCHAVDCDRSVPPKYLMCSKHWAMVPKPQQRDVWRHYRAGQEMDKCPSSEYLAAAKAAIETVYAKESPSPSNPLTPGALVVPKATDSHTPLFPDQVCEVVRMGKSLGCDRAFLVPVKWKGRGVLPFPCDPRFLIKNF